MPAIVVILLLAIIVERLAWDIAARPEFDGPRVKLEGRQIPGSRHIRPNDAASYPLLYGYRTRSGDSRRDIVVYVAFTDAAGHRSLSVGEWKVR